MATETFFLTIHPLPEHRAARKPSRYRVEARRGDTEHPDTSAVYYHDTETGLLHESVLFPGIRIHDPERDPVTDIFIKSGKLTALTYYPLGAGDDRSE